MTRNLARGAILAACLGAFSLRAEEIRTTTLYRTGTLTKSVGSANMIVRDVLGDATPEIVSAIPGGSAFAMSYNGTTYRDTWYSPNIGCRAVTVADRDGNGINEVIAGGVTNYDYYGGGGPSFLYVFDATSYGPEVAKVQISATEAVTDIAAGNVDADSDLEIVAITNTKTYVFNAATLALEWTASWGGHTVLIADLENDGQNEIIIAGSDGTVLNAYTQTFKWGLAGGFGSCVAVGDVDNDGKPEIVGGNGYYSGGVKIVNGDTMTVFSLPGLNSEGITTGDANNDGQTELIIGPNQWGSIEGYSISGTTGTKIWSINDPEHGTMGMTVGDPDGDGKNEIVWGSGWTSSGADSLFVGNANTQTIEYRAPDLDGWFSQAIGDLDGDGDLELVIASASTESGYSSGSLTILDYATRQFVAKISVPATIYDVAIGQVDADAAREIVMLGYSTIVVYDGVTLAKEWTSPASSISSNGFAVRNIDADPVDEIIYATTDRKIQVLNGATEFIQFTSGVLDGYIYDLAIGDVDGDSILDAAVATYGGAYIFRTSDWSERTHVTLTNLDYRQIAIGPGHFAVSLSGSGIATYSGSTLTQEWACTSGNALFDLAFVTLAGQQRVAAALSNTNTLRLFPTGGAACPAYDTMSQPLGLGNYGGGVKIAFADVNGDGRPELLAGGYNPSITALGWNSEPRGDVNLDGLVTDADIDALAAYFYGNSHAAQPGADVNGDGAIRPDDLYYLINYRRGTGAPPPL